MTVTYLNTTKERPPGDFYPTPAWFADIGARLATPPGTGSVLDPCAGDGALLAAVARRQAHIQRFGIELDETRAMASGAVRADALDTDWPQCDSVLMNPPFSLWGAFAEKAVAYRPRRVVIMMRLGLLSSQRRKPFWADVSQWRGVSLYISSRRPSFTGRGTDGHDYGWVVISNDLSERGVFWT